MRDVATWEKELCTEFQPRRLKKREHSGNLERVGNVIIKRDPNEDIYRLSRKRALKL
jgi:hypothetical protein